MATIWEATAYPAGVMENAKDFEPQNIPGAPQNSSRWVDETWLPSLMLVESLQNGRWKIGNYQLFLGGGGRARY